LALVGLLAVAVSAVASRDGSSHRSTAAGTCIPTHPNGYQPHGATPQSGPSHYDGGPGLYVDLGPRMTIFPSHDNSEPTPRGAYVGQLLPNGAIRAKVIWGRDVATPGRLNVTGELLGGSGERLRTRLNRGSRRSKGAFGYLHFTRPGCWHVDARWARAHLGLTVSVLHPR
jgi:hypothetical protein